MAKIKVLAASRSGTWFVVHRRLSSSFALRCQKEKGMRPQPHDLMTYPLKDLPFNTITLLGYVFVGDGDTDIQSIALGVILFCV